MDPVEARVRDVVAALDPPSEVIDIDPDLADTADFVAAYGYSLEDSANCIVVVGKSDPRCTWRASCSHTPVST